MDYSITQNEDVVMVSVTGRLDAASAPRLDEALAAALSDASRLTFDLAELEYISSAGLRTLLVAFKRVSKDGNMQLVNVQPAVMEILELSGFADIFGVHV